MPYAEILIPSENRRVPVAKADLPAVLKAAKASDGYLTTGEAAQALGVSVQTVRRLVDSGELPAVRYGRGRRMVRAEDIDAYKRASAVGSEVLQAVAAAAADLGLYDVTDADMEELFS